MATFSPDFEQELTHEQFPLYLLESTQVQQVVLELISSGRLSSIGTQYYYDMLDRLAIIPPNHETQVAGNLLTAKYMLDHLRALYDPNLFYITGGLEGVTHMISVEMCTEAGGIALIGLEEPEYVESKGVRRSLFTMDEKMSLWGYLAPAGSIIFPMPRKPQQMESGEFYDWVCEYLGIYQDSKVYYLASVDDPPKILGSRKGRAHSEDHLVVFSYGGEHPVHTSGLLS